MIKLNLNQSMIELNLIQSINESDLFQFNSLMIQLINLSSYHHTPNLIYPA